MGLTQAPMQLTYEEVAMLLQYRHNQQRVGSGIPPIEVPLPRTPTAVSLPAVYKGLGPNFTEWGLHFMKRISIAQVQSGFWWRSEDQFDCLQAHLDDKALRHFQTQYSEWMREAPHLEFVMLKLLNAFTVRLTLDQAADIFRRPMPNNRTWGEHYIYLT
jgi:hypothetical protein